MVDINSFKNLLKEDRLAHVYLFIVQETYEYTKILEDVKAKNFVEGFEGFDLDRLDGKNTDLLEIIHTANTSPMASAKRLVVVGDAEGITDHALEEFKKFVTDPNEYCLLLLVANEEIPRKKWADFLLKKNLIVEFKKFDEKNVPGWIVNYLRKKGYGISQEAARIISGQIGDNISEITHQLDKALLFIRKGETIEESMVNDLILRSRRHKFWELSEAAAEKNLSTALLLVNHMIEDGESEISLLGVINNYFRKLLNARYLLNSGLKSEEVCQILGQKWFQRKFIEQAKRFELVQLVRISEFLCQADENMKTGYLTPKDNLERLLLNICTNQTDFPALSYRR
jgi:DNA polymerase-3 subunit delta